MSYILDAIKKADQKRKLGTVPDVNTIHEAPGVEPRRPVWVYGLAAVLFVNAGVIGWWLWSGGSAKAPGPQPTGKVAAVQGERKAPPASPPLPAKITPPPTPVASAPPPTPPPAPTQATSAPVTPSPPTQAAAPTVTPPPAARAVPPTVAVSRPVATPAGAPKPSAGPLPQPGQAGGVPAAPRQPATPPPSTAPAQLTASSPQVVPVIEPGGPVEDPMLEEAMDTGEEEDGGASVAAEEGEGEEVGQAEALVPIATAPSAKEQAKKRRAEREKEEDPELAKIPYLKQLPAEAQQAIPELHISFHSYSIKPASRLVSIGGKILREGQEYDESVTLETITVKGVVLVSNGRRFRLDVQ